MSLLGPVLSLVCFLCFIALQRILASLLVLFSLPEFLDSILFWEDHFSGKQKFGLSLANPLRNRDLVETIDGTMAIPG